MFSFLGTPLAGRRRKQTAEFNDLLPRGLWRGAGAGVLARVRELVQGRAIMVLNSCSYRVGGSSVGKVKGMISHELRTREESREATELVAREKERKGYLLDFSLELTCDGTVQKSTCRARPMLTMVVIVNT